MGHISRSSSIRRAALVAALLLGWAPFAAAQFKFEWTAQGDAVGSDTVFADCNRGGAAIHCAVGNQADPDTTPFLQERLRGDDGNIYYHTVIGDPAGGFAMEVYAQASGAQWQGGPGTASLGGIANGGQPLADDIELTGNGSANPTTVLVRMVIRDGEFTQEFLKDDLLSKPRITQSLETDTMSASFAVDMRHLGYQDGDGGAPIHNTFSLHGPDSPAGGDFDMARDAQFAEVTAGKYFWIGGEGPGDSGGEWQYAADQHVDLEQIEWAAFRDPAQNPPP